MSRPLPAELAKKYKVTIGDKNNTTIFTNSLTRTVDGIEQPKFAEEARIETINT